MPSQEADALIGVPNRANQEPKRTTDAALVERLRAGDTNAFAEIVRAWSPMMLQAARAYVLDRRLGSRGGTGHLAGNDPWPRQLRGPIVAANLDPCHSR